MRRGEKGRSVGMREGEACDEEGRGGVWGGV